MERREEGAATRPEPSWGFSSYGSGADFTGVIPYHQGAEPAFVVDGRKRIGCMAPPVPAAAGELRRWYGGGEPDPIDSDNKKKLLESPTMPAADAARAITSSSAATADKTGKSTMADPNHDRYNETTSFPQRQPPLKCWWSIRKMKQRDFKNASSSPSTSTTLSSNNNKSILLDWENRSAMPTRECLTPPDVPSYCCLGTSRHCRHF